MGDVLNLPDAADKGKPAEVWKTTGETFRCDKDLFDFSLMKQTEAAAAIALPTGAVLGAGIGAGVGAAKSKQNNCSNSKFREELLRQIQETKSTATLAEILLNIDKNSGVSGADEKQASDYISATTTPAQFTEEICTQVLQLQDIYTNYSSVIAKCETAAQDPRIETVVETCVKCTDTQSSGCTECDNVGTNNKDIIIIETIEDDVTVVAQSGERFDFDYLDDLINGAYATDADGNIVATTLFDIDDLNGDTTPETIIEKATEVVKENPEIVVAPTSLMAIGTFAGYMLSKKHRGSEILDEETEYSDDEE